MKFDKVKDSGSRTNFGTGSVRDMRIGKGRFDLFSPLAMRRFAVHMENGARKYGDRNWEKGQPMSAFIDSAMRHIFNYLEGDRSEDHLSAAMWNIHGAIHTEEMIDRGALPKHLYNLPNFLLKKRRRP